MSSDVLFENPFVIEDLQIFDDQTLALFIERKSYGMDIVPLAHCLQGMPAFSSRIVRFLLPDQRRIFINALSHSLTDEQRASERRDLLQKFFWELIYWKKPAAYEELTEGEHLHPGIFTSLGPELAGCTVLDAGAGSGRASFACLPYQPARIYAVDPSPGLLRLLRRKTIAASVDRQVIACLGRFQALPLTDQSIDIALSCSAFTADEEQGGEEGLRELRRVTRPGGKIVIIWPRPKDHQWFYRHGFQYVRFPMYEDCAVHFRSLATALDCAHLFYAHNPQVLRYLLRTQSPIVPFSVIGSNPPCDYFWQPNM